MGCGSSKSSSGNKDSTLNEEKKFAFSDSLFDTKRSSIISVSNDLIDNNEPKILSTKSEVIKDDNKIQETEANEVAKEEKNLQSENDAVPINAPSVIPTKTAVEEEMKFQENEINDAIKIAASKFNEHCKVTEEVPEDANNKKFKVPLSCVGYMMKQGGSIKTWKKRFFILENGVLIYYSRETYQGSNVGLEEKGRIPLSSGDKITLLEEKKGYKLLLSSSLRELPMIVDTKDMANAWTAAINDHISYIKQKEEIFQFQDNQNSIDVLILK